MENCIPHRFWAQAENRGTRITTGSWENNTFKCLKSDIKHDSSQRQRAVLCVTLNQSDSAVTYWCILLYNLLLYFLTPLSATPLFSQFDRICTRRRQLMHIFSWGESINPQRDINNGYKYSSQNVVVCLLAFFATDVWNKQFTVYFTSHSLVWFNSADVQ